MFQASRSLVWRARRSGGFTGKNARSTTPQECLNLIMVSNHDEQKTVGTILKNQTNIQTGSNLEIRRGKFSDAQTLMPVRMTEIPFQPLQRTSDFTARLLGIFPHGGPERRAQIQRFQSARSFSRLPEKRFTVPRLRSTLISRPIRFSNRSISSGVTPYSRQA